MPLKNGNRAPVAVNSQPARLFGLQGRGNRDRARLP